QYLALVESGAFRDSSPEANRQRALAARGLVASTLGDFKTTLRLQTDLSRADLLDFAPSVVPILGVAGSAAALHDIGQARAILAAFEPENPPQIGTLRNSRINVAIAAEDWPATLAAADEVIAA